MLKLFTSNVTQQQIKVSSPNNTINQAITRSMIQADDALNNARFSDAHKFYRYALQLSEMQFGEHDSVVNNLRSLLTIGGCQSMRMTELTRRWDSQGRILA